MKFSTFFAALLLIFMVANNPFIKVTTAHHCDSADDCQVVCHDQKPLCILHVCACIGKRDEDYTRLEKGKLNMN
ncbi:hypothetical protein EJD97_013979 [Solanum chilense]|uniref:Uncharacterized protein n=1 Tax=Solanum chilense TaxID=4083 RepID=A0A6N2AGT5_SOLCI|nr:hypothetical protein EJD97_013979 [Solanum chilense]